MGQRNARHSGPHICDAKGGGGTSSTEARGTGGGQGVKAKGTDMRTLLASSSSSAAHDGASAPPFLFPGAQKPQGDGVSDLHPDLEKHVVSFMVSTVRGPTAIVSSGPGFMGR